MNVREHFDARDVDAGRARGDGEEVVRGDETLVMLQRAGDVLLAFLDAFRVGAVPCRDRVRDLVFGERGRRGDRAGADVAGFAGGVVVRGAQRRAVGWTASVDSVAEADLARLRIQQEE